MTPALTEAVGRLQCFRGISVHAAMVRRDGTRRLAPVRAPAPAGGLSGIGPARRLHRQSRAKGLDHEGRQQPLSSRSGPGRVELSVPSPRGRAAQGPASRATRAGGRPLLEGAAATPQTVPAPELSEAAAIAAVAVARELVGFLWAAMQSARPSLEPATASTATM